MLCQKKLMLWKTFSFASRLIRCFTQSSTQISTGRLQTQTGPIWGYHDNVVLGFQIWGLIRHLCKPQLKLRPVRPTIVGRAKRFLARLRGFYQTVSVKQKIGITQHRYLFATSVLTLRAGAKYSDRTAHPQLAVHAHFKRKFIL